MVVLPKAGRLLQVFDKLPRRARVGMFLVGLCWVLNWSLPGLRTHLLFFPQWLGYCLFIDGLVEVRKGSSLITRDWKRYLFLFILSAPVWWIFEGLNTVTGNWIYLGRESFSDTAYVLYATLSFSTVIPAVFSTAELLGTITWFQRKRGYRTFRLERHHFLRLHVAGWGMMGLMLLAPSIFFPFMWLSVFFIIDPLNALRGHPSLIREFAGGDYRRLFAYGLGALLCGFFWELWNLYAYPKWIYEIPYLEVLHVFEMPLAGYGGYIPFGWELFALYAFVNGFKKAIPKTASA
jgi:hypothetical protein